MTLEFWEHSPWIIMLYPCYSWIFLSLLILVYDEKLSAHLVYAIIKISQDERWILSSNLNDQWRDQSDPAHGTLLSHHKHMQDYGNVQQTAHHIH